jgi:hypothetical protein
VKPTIAILTTLVAIGTVGPALAKQRSSEDAQFPALAGSLLEE